MKKIILILVLIIMFITPCYSDDAEKWKYYFDNEEITLDDFYSRCNNKDIVENTDVVLTVYLENGNLLQKVNLKKCKFEGEALFYHDNGNISAKDTYKNNKLDGLSIRYYENGNIKHKSNFKNGVLDGIAIAYYFNGKIGCKYLYKNDLVVEQDCK